MRHVAIPSAALMLAAWSLASPASQLPGAGAKLLAETQRAVASVTSSAYEHTTDIDARAGRYVCDCSGLVVYLLRTHLPEHFKAVPKHEGKPRAVAENFHAMFDALPADGSAVKGWSRVTKLTDAQPGDVLVWRHDDPKPGSTGHVMVIAAPIRREGPQFRVTVIDSARTPHADDTRKTGQTGLGRGDVFLTADDNGSPTGYRWAKPDGQLHRESIRIARPR